MSVLMRRPGNGAARTGLILAVMVAIVGLFGLHAAGAKAAASCEGSNITGEGTALQTQVNQNVWIPGFAASTCTEGTPQVSYVPTSSVKGLEDWGAFDGETIDHESAFISTSLAPNESQIENIRAATGKQGGEEPAEVQVIPVAQTATVILANPPAHCTLTQIKRNALQKVFSGKKKMWSDIGTAEGIGCFQAITRVVPSGVSGESNQLKHYLGLVESGELNCLTAPDNTWDAIQSTELNTTWPEACKGHKGLTTVVRASNEVGTVNATRGSFGFAALPEAQAGKAGRTTLLAVQNGSGRKFAAPTVGSTDKANCASATYQVPPRARPGAAGVSVDWSAVYGSTLESATYPICGLTWDLALDGYVNAGFSESAEESVRDYLYWYMFGNPAKGQPDLAAAEAGYATLPSTGNPETDVFAAAVYAASKIQ